MPTDSEPDFDLARRAVARGWVSKEQVESAIQSFDRSRGTRFLAHLPLTPDQIRALESRVPVEAATAMADPANRCGRYWRGRKLGAGGMGFVYLAWDADLGRWVALKFLKSLADETARAWFGREAQLAASLDHPNIAKVYEQGEVDGAPFIAMQYVDGATLAAAKLGLAEKVRAVAAVADAVEFAHARGIIHRDLKPSNVMLDSRGQAFVMDFGLAKETSVEGLTRTNAVMGTPNYMAPEQARGKATAQSDVYSIGGILYEAATGRPPFVGESAGEVLTQVLTADPILPSRLAPAISPDLEAIILKALEKDPVRRYPGVSALKEDLAAYSAGEPLKHARRATWGYVLAKRVRKQPLLWAAVAAAILGVLGGAGFGTWQLFRATRESERRVVEVTSERDAAQRERDRAESESRRARHEEWTSRLETARSFYERSFGLEEAGRHQAAAACLLRAVEIAWSGGAPEGYPRSPDWAEEAWTRFRVLDVHRPRQLLRIRFPQILALAVSADGDRIVAVDEQGSLKAWDGTGRELPLASAGATCVAVGGFEAIVGYDRQVRIWDLRTGRARVELPVARATAVALSEDGRFAAALAADGVLHTWIEGTHESVPTEASSQAQFSRSGSVLLFADAQRKWHLWNTVLRKPVDCPLPAAWPATLDGDGEHVLGVEEGVLRLWKIPDATSVQIAASFPTAAAAAMSPNGLFAALVAQDGSIRLWSTALRERLTILEGLRKPPRALAFNRNGSSLVVADDEWIRVWQPAPGLDPEWSVSFEGGALSLALSPDGTRVLVGSGDPRHYGPPSTSGTVTEIDAKTGAVIRRIEGHGGSVEAIAFAPDGRRIATACDDGFVRIWSGKEDFRVAARGARVAFSADGGTLVVGAWDRTARFFEGGREVRSLRLDGPCLSVTPDGRRAFEAWEGRGRVWDLDQGREVVSVVGVSDANSAVFGPSLVTGSTEGFRVWDLRTGAELRRFEFGASLHPSGTHVAFSPDARLLASGSWDGRVRIWDATTWRELRRWQISPVSAVAFSRDGGSVIGAGADGTVRCWKLAQTLPAPRFLPDDEVDPFREFGDLYRSVGLRVTLGGSRQGEIEATP